MGPFGGLAIILILGVVSQWLSWHIRVPTIILLLFFGFLAGPVFELVNPDILFGDLLFPIIAYSVAVILFEGGLGLRLFELVHVGKVFRNLVSIGILISWALGALGAYFILKLSVPLSLLLGSILVVTGPTVIGPLLRQLKPVGQVGSILKWEGIVIDPIGAILALLVFQGILSGGVQEAFTGTSLGVIKSVIAGTSIGLVSAFFMTFILKKYWVPDYLQNPLTLMTVVGAYALSNLFQGESGLLAVTVMGIALANQKFINVKKIIDFKENLRVLLISGLFILLAARVKLDDLTHLGLDEVWFLVFLILVVRPASVFISTIGSKLNWKEKIFLSCMAPRGIVAAAIISIFSFELIQHGFPEAESLVPITFMMIIGTVVAYSALAHLAGKFFGLTNPNPQGMLFVGAHSWARDLAKNLIDEGFWVQLVDTNYENIVDCRKMGLKATQTNVLSEAAVEKLDLQGVGRMLALTPNDEVNSLTSIIFTHFLGSTHVYQLTPHDKGAHAYGRLLFDKDANFNFIQKLAAKGIKIKTTKITEEFDYDNFLVHYNHQVLPLFVITPKKELLIFTSDHQAIPKPGQTLVSMVLADAETEEIKK